MHTKKGNKLENSGKSNSDEWASEVDPLKPWLQYPRPDMVRNAWINLNGLWDYSVTQKGKKPEKWSGSILVPILLNQLFLVSERKSLKMKIFGIKELSVYQCME